MKGAYTTEKPSSELAVSLGKNDFLKLLLAELQHQDPLNPASSTEFVAQLAQFSSLEQLTTMNSSLEATLKYNQSLSESINNSVIVNLIGKTVTAQSNEFAFDGLSPVQLSFELDNDVASGTVKILDSDQNTIREISLDSLSKGLRSVTWDGLTALGVPAKSEGYTYEVTAYDRTGNPVTVSPVFIGVVNGISYREGKSYLDIGGVLVPFDQVKDIIDSGV